MRAIIIGNCQAPGLARCLHLMAPQLDLTVAKIGQTVPELGGERRFDVVLSQPTPGMDPIATLGVQGPVVPVPRIVFNGFHPDMGFLMVGRRHLPSPTGAFHSKLAIWAHLRGLDVAATSALFQAETFERIGYDQAWRSATDQLLAEGRQTGSPIADLFPQWRRQGCFMHGIVQPKLFVLAGVARALLDRLGIEPAVDDASAYLHDELKSDAVWGVYPPLAERLDVAGAYAFKAPGNGPPQILGLDAFIAASFALYADIPPEQMTCPDLDYEQFDRLLEPAAAPAPLAAQASVPLGTEHPYRRLPAHRFWRQAVAASAAGDVDPVVRAPFTIEPSDRVVTAGSCFAQHIAQGLARAGLNHFVVEPDVDGAFPAYAARYGNIYTARQLVQLFDRAHGRFSPSETAWRRADGAFEDPFRQALAHPGWPSEPELDRDRATHLAAVRRLFAELDVFIFTLGLTEAWFSRDDGAVFPLAPGVVAGQYDPDRHHFVNYSAAEVAADLDGFVGRLREVNPGARIVLTVSPVPLAATFEDRHVLVASTYSKAVLRVAAEEVARRYDQVTYFPSFEIVSGVHQRGRAFGDDLRSVEPTTVSRVISLFLRHYARTPTAATDPLFSIICEEEALDPGRSAS